VAQARTLRANFLETEDASRGPSNNFIMFVGSNILPLGKVMNVNKQVDALFTLGKTQDTEENVGRD
jgi:hypothetical protein